MDKLTFYEAQQIEKNAYRAGRASAFEEIGKMLEDRADFLDKTKRSIIDVNYLRHDLAKAIRALGNK